MSIRHVFVAVSLFLTFSSVCHSQEAYQWGNVAIGGGGFVSAIITSKSEKDLIYARTDVGGAYRWNATSQQWIPLLDWVGEHQRGYLGVESLAIDPQAPNKLYMLVGISYFDGGQTAILRSDNYGETFSVVDVTGQFKAHGNGMGRQAGEKLVVDPNNNAVLFTGTRWNGLFKSTDFGQSWAHVDSLNVTTTPNENGISFVTVDGSRVADGASQTLFVGVSRTGENFYRSDDGGASFTAVAGGPSNLMPHRAVLASDGDLYITYGNGAGPHGHWVLDEPMDQGAVWKYNAESGQWSNVTPAGYTRAFGGISVDPQDPKRLVLSTINAYMAQGDAWGDRFFLSTDGGDSWTDLYVDLGFEKDNAGVSWLAGHSIHWAGSIEFDPFDSSTVWVTSGNGVFRTTDISASPVTWRFTVAGLEETVPLDLVSVVGGPLISVIGDYDGFRHPSSDSITDYAPIHNPQMGTTEGLAVAAQNPNKVVRVGNLMYYSLDGGVTWTQTAKVHGVKGRVALSADGAVIVHAPADSTATYRSTDNGTDWSAVTGLQVTGAHPVADPVNKNKFYAYNPATGSMLASTDGGASFSTVGTLASGGSKRIVAVPDREGEIWVPLRENGLARSTDSGTTFTSVADITYGGAVGFGKPAPDAEFPTVFLWGTVDGVRGVYRSTDEGASWIRINDDLHEYGGPGNGSFVVGDMNIFGRVYMSTAGRGLVYGEPVVSGEPGSSSSSASSSSSDPTSSSSSSSVASSSSSVSSSATSSSSASSGGGGALSPYVLLLLLIFTRIFWRPSGARKRP
jgi:xyloglucan-specific exo-beta-1,4-glucanase